MKEKLECISYCSVHIADILYRGEKTIINRIAYEASHSCTSKTDS